MKAVSLFAGIGGIDLALQRAGIEVVAAVEIDPACRDILGRHFPHAILFDDVTKVTGNDLLTAGFVPGDGLLAAGWPCQDNSVAGRRKGMAGARSGLWREVVRLLAATRPAWFLGENVPGLLSVNRGRDFAQCIGDLADLGMGFCWRVLDAQHFGVPQRRRRVFVVGRAGDDHAAGPVKVLLEPESGDGDLAARGSAWPGTATASDGGTVGTLQGGGRRGHRIGADEAVAGQLIAWDAAQITHPENRVNPQPGDPSPPLAATSGSRIHIAQALLTKSSRTNPDQTWVVPLAVCGREGGAQLETGAAGDPMYALRAGNGGSSRSPLIAHSLTAEGADASEDGTGRGTPLVVDVAQTVRAANGQPGCVATAAVRRLTPLECERLQGFPDGWTAGQSDSTRYRQLGNAVAVPVAEWIAHRIAREAS